jgi:phenylacetate-CoA ligase
VIVSAPLAASILLRQPKAGLQELRQLRAGRHLRAEGAAWSEPAIRAWQLRRLGVVLRQAAAGSAFWRDRIGSAGLLSDSALTFERFRQLPVLEKTALRGDTSRMRTLPDDGAGVTRDSTGGSTGEPIQILLGPRERAWRRSGSDHSMMRIGLGPSSRRALLWGHHLDPVARDGWRDRLVDRVLRRQWFDCFHVDQATYQRYDAQMRAFRPDVIVAYARALGELARHASVGAGYPRVACVTGAEKLSDADRNDAERAFGVPVHERYGSRDVGDMAFQYHVPTSRHFTTDWALVLLEVEGDDDVGQLLVTKLQADAFPMLRYRIGDLVRTTAGERAEVSLLRLEEVAGRSADRVRLPNGAWVSGMVFPHLFKDFPVRAFQVHQAADFAVTARVVPINADALDTAALGRALERALPGLAVTVEAAQRLQETAAGKLRPVISEVSS